MMEHPHVSYAEMFSFYPEVPGIEFPLDGIEPRLKRSTSPEDIGSQWNPPQIHRYLADSNKSSFFTTFVPTETMMPVAPFPPNMPHQRQNSPSYSHPSSTCSSALSPPRESDFCQIQSPSTPTETGPLSPYSNPYESHGLHSQQYHLTGLTGACVKPNDVYQEAPINYYEDTARYSPRTLSMSSDDSRTSADQFNGAGPFLLARQLSPDILVSGLKHELHAPNTDGAYPPIEPEEEAASSDEIEPPNLKTEDDDDDDYMPNKRAKRPAPIANRAAKRCKRSAPSQSSLGATRIKMDLDDPTAMGSSSKPIQGTKGNFFCDQCPNRSFKDRNGLDGHVKKTHTRPFTCVFEFAGCTSTFASKNEWKRHCCSQHLVLNYWVCQQEQCIKNTNGPCASNRPTGAPRNRCSPNRPETNCTSTLPNGTIFNRKDLYTQHLRRMHLPSDVKKQVKQKKAVPDQEERERAHQEAAIRTRCRLPTHMRCPAVGCNVRFDGTSAWDDRMEHVAKHLDKAAAGAEPPIIFGGDNDKTLMDWAMSPSVDIITRSGDGRWVLRNPLKPTPAQRRDPHEDKDEDEDLDAEGEEIDE